MHIPDIFHTFSQHGAARQDGVDLPWWLNSMLSGRSNIFNGVIELNLTGWGTIPANIWKNSLTWPRHVQAKVDGISTYCNHSIKLHVGIHKEHRDFTRMSVTPVYFGQLAVWESCAQDMIRPTSARCSWHHWITSLRFPFHSQRGKIDPKQMLHKKKHQ